MRKSAGLLLYRKVKGKFEVLLVHPGGPFWAKKELASWSIPKGEYDENESPLQAAQREFNEELGLVPPDIEWTKLNTVKYSGKEVSAWAGEANIDIGVIKSNSFELEWPPKSGKKSQFPEVDKAGWFGFEEARAKIVPGQQVLLVSLQDLTD
jgi:predicted NUDIX family NTP pyrophosphohydrolase